jgi:hypothetical protein
MDQLTSGLGAFGDESSIVRSSRTQEYLIGAAILDVADQDRVREELRPLLLPGQIKVHWTDENARRRRRIVDAIVQTGPMNVVITHLSLRQHQDERFRRKCLETLYYELGQAGVFTVTLKSRSAGQDARDRAHIVALQSQGLDRRIRLGHRRGGDEPLLWIADAVLGAMNSAHSGDRSHLEALQETIVLEQRTPESLAPSDWLPETDG